MAEDEDLGKLEHVLRTWHPYDPALIGISNRLVEAAMDTDQSIKAVERRAFLEALREWTGTPIDKPPCGKALSYRFRAAKDRCVGGFRVVQDSIRTGSGFRWAVVQDAQ